jgi:uncharacterized OsmC-like protein
VHNVRVERVMETAVRAAEDPLAAILEVELEGEWRTEATEAQFGGVVVFPLGKALFEADFPAFLGGEGRAPSPLAYYFYGAMACYGSTFATQAALAGLPIADLRVKFWVSVDFRSALGQGDFAPLSALVIDVEVDTDVDELELQRVKTLTDERCPAMWAMKHHVPHRTVARRSGQRAT